ncbi:DUF1177 domain-containing protein [Nocardiopsis sp. MG754419]|uniref:DUF1177 domain-containing protein n=1 Tax=Nocardiopsis sp. MG754419 TaxID=2259865 RepID=UPI001BA86EB4|nr:DUF1177 domain-containing protein [Nocardiopsis sp. MG754419]MBR8742121.1 DUF1177 domain-containing protein [Nocardiopsis sp. MG754419]
MSWSHVIETYDLLDTPAADGATAAAYLRRHGADDGEVHVETVAGSGGSTDFLRVTIPGTDGATVGGSAPTLGILGRLGGLGARPEQIGFVSDGDGALTAVSAAAKLLDMRRRGDTLPGDVVLATHIDPDAPTQPHDPVPFMGSVVDQDVSNEHEVLPAMDAILSVDTTKGNRVCNHHGIAITPTVVDGWIVRVPETLLDIVSRTTGRPPVVMPLTMQDITPYGNGVYHVNSILQPSTATSAPVVGVAIVTETAVAGSATGATDLRSVETAVRFVIEAAKDYGRGIARFVDADEVQRLQDLYGSMSHLRGAVGASV